ncbi:MULTISPECIES: lipopolysaccharide assembly protein LapA domain-containing protein [Dyella]|uniref:LapA family protein n=2 Tax=Dyella TaxID=231454 RepID=A0A4V2NMF6_9GAMM|nr:MULTISPECIES: LapA family protein [Dyella]TBR39305.1 LapA family protein [Dyella terrae]TCI13107.1 LapA family protein [Dyella soli]
MRLIVMVILLLFIAAGIVLGALNADLVGYDLGFVQFEMPKGAALLTALVVGWLLGGLTAWLGVSGRHRRERKQASRRAETRQSVDA